MANDVSELITPKSGMDNKNNSEFFRLKRQLHKSSLGNVSNELASAERLNIKEVTSNIAKNINSSKISEFQESKYCSSF